MLAVSGLELTAHRSRDGDGLETRLPMTHRSARSKMSATDHSAYERLQRRAQGGCHREAARLPTAST